MSPRRPAGQSWESYVERQIREAQERGDFDRLPGAGKPFRDLDQPRHAEWWIRKKLKEEQFVKLPPALQLRRDVEKARRDIAAANSERAVREIVTAINTHIRYVNRTIVHGPASTVMALDEDDTVRRWYADRGNATD